MSQSRGRARGAVILLYHVVDELDADPFKLAVGPDRFAEHMEIIATQFRPHTLAEVADGLAAGTLAPRSVAVTFDDGYANNLTQAFPRLTRASVPATVFVATGYIGSDREFWWDELERLVMLGAGDSARDPLEVTLNGEVFTAGPRTPSGTLLALRGWLHRHEPSAIDTVLAQVRRWVGIEQPLAPRESRRAMTVDELVTLAGSGLVELAPHTRLHPVLDACSSAVQRSELQSSRDDLQRWLACSCESFAYPYGNPARDYSPTTVEIVRELGFRQAVSSNYGLATAASSRLELPRYFVPDLEGAAFERWLHDRFLPRGMRISRRVSRRLLRSR